MLSPLSSVFFLITILTSTCIFTMHSRSFFLGFLYIRLEYFTRHYLLIDLNFSAPLEPKYATLGLRPDQKTPNPNPLPLQLPSLTQDINGDSLATKTRPHHYCRRQELPPEQRMPLGRHPSHVLHIRSTCSVSFQ